MKNAIFNYTICNLHLVFYNKINTTFAMRLSKWIFFLTFNFITLQTFNLAAQGITKNGMITGTSNNFVNLNGRIGTIQTLDKNGRRILSCNNFVMTHTVGSIAPVTKTINYQVVRTSLSGSSKCWIIQNLGANNPANSFIDNTDASAGWYWQFNRKQGYAIGPTTPSWNSSAINESCNWLPANDPCTLLLGAGWRIPTFSELGIMPFGGSQSNYAQELRLHAGGMLSNGTLSQRGTKGFFWTSSSYITTTGYMLTVSNSSSQSESTNKGFGGSLRCLAE